MSMIMEISKVQMFVTSDAYEGYKKLAETNEHEFIAETIGV